MTVNLEKSVITTIAREDPYFFARYLFRQRKRLQWLKGRHHPTIFAALNRVYTGQTRNLLINMPPRYSKAIDCDTPMWTPQGWRAAGQIQVGDSLMGSDGQWTRVDGVFPQGVKPAFNVKFSDGAELVACDEHRWAARLRDNVKGRDWVVPWHVKTTAELRSDLFEADGRKKWRIPVMTDTRTEDVELPIDPYVFGCWLGDGSSHYAAITTMDAGIVAAFHAHNPKPHTHQSAGRAISFGLPGGLHKMLRELGVLKNKHIPDCYMRASHAQRLALLQGLCDTDGWVAAATGQQGFCFSNERLSDDARALVCSLGGTWRGFSSLPPRGKMSHKTFFLLPDGDVAFRLQRKVERINPRGARNVPRRFVAEIEPVPSREMVCFTVAAADHLFCAGREFVVTHNTESVTSWIAWCMGHEPDAEFIYLSYAAPLARENSGVVRQMLLLPEYREIFPRTRLMLDSRAKEHWKTTANGVMYASGSEGTITGFGAGKERPGFGGAIVIDDPHKPDEARSPARRASVINNFKETIKSRRNQPQRTPIIVIMQRLHMEDLSGHVISGDDGETWEVLNLPALSADGVPLWPEKHDLTRLRQMEAVDPYTFAGQYQQRPAPLSGGDFKPDRLEIVDTLPAGHMQYVRGWDLAASTTSTAAWTVGVLMARHVETRRTFVVDVVRDRVDALGVRQMIKAAASRDPQATLISIPQDPGQAGKAQVHDFAGHLNGYIVSFSPESGDKVGRAQPFAAQVNAGNVSLLRGAWNNAYTEELRMFPNGFKDQVDASSRAFAEMDDTMARFRALAGG